jgi:hypothetical protein
MSLFTELADSKFRNVSVAVKLLIGVKDVSYIQGVTGGTGQTSAGCSLGPTIPI